MACDCITEVNDMLKERNTELGETIVFANPSYVTVTLHTEAITRKRGARPVAMLPTFCPFCGTRYKAEGVAE